MPRRCWHGSTARRWRYPRPAERPVMRYPRTAGSTATRNRRAGVASSASASAGSSSRQNVSKAASSTASTSARSERRARRMRTGGGRAGERGQVVHEQVEVLAHDEPGIDEGRHLGPGERTGHDLVHAPPAQHLDAVAHRRAVGRDRAGERGDQRHPLVAVAGNDAEAVGSDPEQLGLGHGDPAWSFTRSPRIGPDTPASGARSVRSRAVTLLVVTDPRFLDHDTGAGHPERPTRLRGRRRRHRGRPGWATRSAPGPRRAGAPRRGRGGPPCRARRRARAVLRGRRRRHRRRHPRRPGLVRGRHAGGRVRASSWSGGLDAGEGTVGFCAVRPPGHHATATRCHGVLPVQQRGGHRGGPGRPGRAGRDRRLRRPPRQRHAGHLLRGPPGPLRVAARVAAVPRHRARSTRSGPARVRARRSTSRSRRAPRATCTGGPSTSWSCPAIERFAPTWVLLSAGFDAHRADPLTGLGAVLGRLRRPHRPGWSRSCPTGPPPPLPRGRVRPRGPARLDRGLARCGSRCRCAARAGDRRRPGRRSAGRRPQLPPSGRRRIGAPHRARFPPTFPEDPWLSWPTCCTTSSTSEVRTC